MRFEEQWHVASLSSNFNSQEVTSMESPNPQLTKRTLRHWLMLLSVIMVTLGGFVWWKLRSERLRFVETIWSDSLIGSGTDSATTGQRRKIGEVWALTRSGGFSLLGRGLSRDFMGQYPVFTPANSFQQSVSDKWQTEMRDASTIQTEFNWTESWEWSRWWDGVLDPSVGGHEQINVFCDILFVSDRGVSFRERLSRYEDRTLKVYGSRGRNFVEQDGRFHEVQLDELFRGTEWAEVISDFCRSDLRRQGTEFLGLVGTKSNDKEVLRALSTHLSQNGFAMTPYGLHCFFPPYFVKPNSGKEFEVLIPFKILEEHLKPDGSHRLFLRAGQ